MRTQIHEVDVPGERVLGGVGSSCVQEDEGMGKEGENGGRRRIDRWKDVETKDMHVESYKARMCITSVALHTRLSE